MTEARVPTIGGFVDRLIRESLHATHVCQPGRVVTYDSADNTCAVQPLFHTVVTNEEEEQEAIPLPQIPGVPVAWLSFGGWELVGTLVPGDLVLLVFADRALDRWFADPTLDTDPGGARAHALADAIALPVLSSSRTEAAGTAPLMLRRADGSSGIELRADGTIALNAGGEADQHLVRGEALLAWLTPHVHPTAFGPSGASTPPPLASDLLSLLGMLR